MTALRVLGREPMPDGGVRLRYSGGHTVLVANGTSMGEGWSWATLDSNGNIIRSGKGELTSRNARLAAVRTLR